jgi:RsiW-degrading membrane proteinase PrsW (M82 family)
MSALVLGGSAVVPSLLLLWYVYARDRNPEPRGLLLKTFFLGAAICVPVVPVAMGLQSLGEGMAVGIWGSALVRAFLGAAIPEELFKYLVLRRFVWNKTAFDEPLDGVVYGVTASLGFATLENILYVGEGGLGVAVLRALTAVPCHAFTGMVMGAYVGRARFATEPGERFRLLAAGLGWAVLLHGAYDAFLMTNTAFAVLALGVLVFEIVWGRRLYKALQGEQLQAGLRLQAVTAQVVVTGQAMATEEAPGLAVGMGPVVTTTVESHAAQLSVVRTSRRPPPPQRAFSSWVKLGFGGVGLTACGLWWLLVAAVLFLPDSDPLALGAKVALVIVSLVPTALFGLLFYSGLRGPFVPQAQAVG